MEFVDLVEEEQKELIERKMEMLTSSPVIGFAGFPPIDVEIYIFSMIVLRAEFQLFPFIE